MNRTLMQHGDTSLTITMPKKWIVKHRLKKGDEISLTEDKGNIIVSTSIRSEVKKGVLDINKLGHFNKNYINSMYKAGYDEIKVLTKSLKVFDAIQERVSWMVGYEIFEKDKEGCIIKAVSKEMPEEFEQLMRRSFLVTLEHAESVFEALKLRDYKQLKATRSLEQTNNKFTELCRRILYKYGYKEQDKTIFAYNIARDLERISDRYKYMTDFILDNNVIVNKDTLGLMNRVNNYLKGFYELYYKFIPELAKKYNDERYKIIEEADKLIKRKLKKDAKELLVIAYLKELTQLIYEPYAPYFSMVL